MKRDWGKDDPACEACLDKDDAKKRENYLKTSGGESMLKLRLKQYFYKQKSRKIS